MTRHPKQRSAVTNGRRVLMGLGANTDTGRRFKDLLHEAEAERGGTANMTVTAREAARQWAMLAVQAELMHAALARGEPVDMEAFGQIGDRMERQARAMGKPLTARKPSIHDRLAARRAGGN